MGSTSTAAMARSELSPSPGDPAAGGGEVVSAIQPRVNDKGDIVYAAEVTGPSGEQAWSLFLAEKNGSTRAIVRAGDLLPDGFHFDEVVRSLNSWSLNNKGEVAFVARAHSPPDLVPWGDPGLS